LKLKHREYAGDQGSAEEFTASFLHTDNRSRRQAAENYAKRGCSSLLEKAEQKKKKKSPPVAKIEFLSRPRKKKLNGRGNKKKKQTRSRGKAGGLVPELLFGKA